MPLKQHDRQYDMVVFGATGYTGKFTAQHITTHLPTTLRWAIAGRSQAKLEALAEQCKKWNPDRPPPAIEICSLSDADLASLASKTFILLTTVGPYGRHGEPAFRACAEQGTHYLDVTGEVPFVKRMITRYASTASASGALMFPQVGIESAPSDLVTWTLARVLRETYGPTTKLGDVTESLMISGAPSGGTLASALTIMETFPLRELRAAYKPFALSPVPNPNPRRPKAPSILTRLTGLVRLPVLGGLQTTSIANRTDGAIVERTWGLLASTPALRDQAYGPNFSFTQYMRARSVLMGVGIHFGLMVLGLVMATPFLRRFVGARVTQPGEGADFEAAKKDRVEYVATARPDFQDGRTEDDGRVAYCRAAYKGPNYYFTAILLAEAAATVLQDDIPLTGGVYTPACLGQGFIDRLEKAGFHFEAKMLDA
ncbi:Saccharopine dehydrogenase-like oxidoreductase [Echria macrotheca]|uniref:Saccharopine dehydrogenase-like oxidoreductase n=1 Tax=Echria macrotheca TaxID=438768 RepID=A0AAJ0BE57_9PEZI|nr:Saccharopine dehydrogenase-like oxidoreductase [Echria macrotheca]